MALDYIPLDDVGRADFLLKFARELAPRAAQVGVTDAELLIVQRICCVISS